MEGVLGILQISKVSKNLVQALFFKKRGEEAVQQCGIDYAILRPGKLLDQLPAGRQKPGRIIIRDPRPSSLPPPACSETILRSQVWP